MNIYFLASWFPSRVIPTNGNFVARHARLVARQHTVTVVNIQDDPALAVGATEIVEESVDGYRVVQVYFGQGGVPGPLRVALRFRAWKLGLKRAEELYGRPDILHGHVLLDGGIMAWRWGIKWKLPYVITEHSSKYHSPRVLPFFRQYLARAACRSAVAIMPVSEHLGRCMRELNGLVGTYKVVSNVVDAELFLLKPIPPRKSLRLLHVSSFKPEKNVIGILQAFTELKQCTERPVTLHLAGDGNLDDIRQAIKKSGTKKVTCSGPHTEAEVASLLASHHAFVLFSRFENQPVVLLEAQMAGRPCIATPVGGIPDVVLPGETGLLVPSEDMTALTAAIADMRDNYDQFDLPAIRERALGLYSEVAVMTALEEEYQRALRSEGSAPSVESGNY